MKLRQRIELFAIILSIILFIIIFVTFNLVVLSVFKQFERDYIIDRASITQYTLKERVDFIGKMAADWAVWDDAYYFVKDRNSKFVEVNLVPSTFENLQLNGILIIDNNSSIIYQEFYSIENNGFFDLNPESTKEVYEFVSMLKNEEKDSSEGLLLLNNEIVLFAADRIYDSNKEKESPGWIVFARYLDSDEKEILRTHITHPISIEVDTTKDYREKDEKSALIDEGVYMKIIDSNNVEGIVQIDDFKGDPIGFIHITVPRVLHKKAENAYIPFIILVFFGIIVLAILAYMALIRQVIKKIGNIDSTISDIIKSEDLTKKVEISGDDELVSLSQNFNNLTSQLMNKESELKANNAAIEEANEELRKLDRLKDEFLSTISHEIKTPLTGLKSYNQLLLSNEFGKLSKEQREAMKIITESTNQLERMVNRLLDSSKYEAGKMHLDIEKTNINKIINEVIKEFYAEIKRTKGSVELKPYTEKKPIMIDSDKIKEVIRNLLSNSIKYKSDRKLLIKLDLKKDKDNLIIDFSDNGIGISDENLKNIFNKFYQVDQSSKRKVGGTGLGLSIVKHIVKLHGGDIKVESEFGKGTRFLIILPIKT